MEHALVRGDVRMLDDPLRAQSLSLTAGVVLTAIIVAVCVVLAFLHPPSVLGSAPIVVVRDSGALYVRVGDVVHPVLNLASARLVANSPVNPEAVSAAAISNADRGPLIGIPGAPAEISPPLGEDESGWAVCDDETGTTVIAGAFAGDRFSTGPAVLVTPRGESAASTYLLYGGWRAKVDLRNRAVVRALQLDGVSPRFVSRTLLDAIPESPPIAPPYIPGAGAPSPLRGFPVGSIVRIARAAADEYYVVHAAGVQRVGQVAADLIRFTDSQKDGDIKSVPPDVIGAMPIVDTLRVSSFPDVADVSHARIVCARWQITAADAKTTVLVGDSLPANSSPLTLAQSDGDGPNVDSFSIPRGRSAYVRSIGIDDGRASAGALYFVTEAGVVFGLRNEETAKHLGLPGSPVAAPWPVLVRLPRGPELSKEAASLVRDTVAGPS
jgi:type VII secretion protein EccB